MHLGYEFIKAVTGFLAAHWLVMLVLVIGFAGLVFIARRLWHPDNQKIYQSHAHIPLEDLLEDETSPPAKPDTGFSIFL